MDLLLLLKDQVNHLPCLADTEVPTPDCTLGVVLVLRSTVHGVSWSTSRTSAQAFKASAGSAATCVMVAGSGTIRYTYRTCRWRINACISSNGTASGLPPACNICSALLSIR